MPQTIDATTTWRAKSTHQCPSTSSVPLRLNLGAGTNDDGTVKEIPGFTPVDRKLGSEVYPLAYPDGVADEIRASHVLEHFKQNDVANVIADWVRVLKPGGILRIAVPNLPAIFEAYRQKIELPILSFIYGGQTDENDFHRVGFDENLLRTMLWEAGLEDVRKWESEIEDCAKNLGEYSLNLMGRKPSQDGVKKLGPEVAYILAAPRLGYTMHFWCIQRAMAELGIAGNIIQGCFWHQQLVEGMQKHIDAGFEYVLTLDYDTVFQSSDVVELYRQLQANPDADAVCALQSKRGGNEVLFSMPGGGTQRVSVSQLGAPMMQIGTGHFGLTMFRASSLKTFPTPWMVPQPGKDGKYGEGTGHVDADIDFWHRWEAAGKKLYLACRVPVGHIEEKIKWPSALGDQPIYQGVQEYTQIGKPAGVWI